MKFKKGHIPWNKDKKGLQKAWNEGLTKETDERVRKNAEATSRGSIGKKVSLKDKKRLTIIILKAGKKTRFTSKRIKEMWQNLEYKERTSKKISKALKGKKKSSKHRKNLSISHKGLLVGEKNGRWIDGRSFKPYSSKFNKELKRRIKERDSYICQLCNITEEKQKKIDSLKRGLTIHHIDYNKKNCRENNLITLCRSCNAKVNTKRKYWSGYFQKLIKLNK